MSSAPSKTSDTRKDEVEIASPVAPPDLEKQSLEQQQPEYITGLKLWSVMAGISLVCFLMLLDMSIVSTVSTCPSVERAVQRLADKSRPGNTEDH